PRRRRHVRRLDRAAPAPRPGAPRPGRRAGRGRGGEVMGLAAEFDSRTARRAYAVVSLGAAALSYDHARSFFLPFMGTVGATVTPLMLDAVVYWLATACIRQARQGRPLPMLRMGAYVLLALSIT